MLRRFGAVAVVAASVVATLAGPAPASIARRVRAASAPGAVGVRTEEFVDRTRPTPADVVAGILPVTERRLPTTIYYPARGKAGPDGAAVPDARPRGGRHPLVLFAGGAPGTPTDYAPLLEDWAKAGYVVAAPQFPISSLAGPDDVAWSDLPRQTGDARFVLRRVLALDASRAGIPEIDAEHIAVAGHSLGGATALSLVARCCRSKHVDVVLVLAGVTDPAAGPALTGLRGPAFFVHARNDRAVPYGPARDTCSTVEGWKRILTVEDLRGVRAHVTPYLGDDQYAAIVRPATVDFLDGYLRDRAAARDRLARAGAGTTDAKLTRCRAVQGQGR
jgi:dienelactone hydrolase